MGRWETTINIGRGFIVSLCLYISTSYPEGNIGGELDILFYEDDDGVLRLERFVMGTQQLV